MIKKGISNFMRSELFSEFLFQKNEASSSRIYFVYINPRAISHISIIPNNASFLSGVNAIYGAFKGTFDLFKRSFEKDFMYKSVLQIMEGGDIKSTPYFKKTMKRKSKIEAVEQVKKLEDYIQLLSTQGYLSQYQLGRSGITQPIGNVEVPRHEINIGMDRKGRFFRIKGGRHRLAVAQHLGIEEMPAILTHYHQDAEQWLPDKKRVITGAADDFRPFLEKEHEF